MQGKRCWRGIAAGLVMMLCVTGCSREALSKDIVFTTGLTEKEVFKIGGMPCTVGEARLLLVNVKNQYEEAFGEEIWDQEIEGQAFQTYVKDMVKNQLAQLTCMVLYAGEEGITLSAEERELLGKAAEEYYQSLTAEEQELLGASQADVQRLYENLSVAERLYDTLTQDVEDEISDAEAKVIVVAHIFKDCTGASAEERAEKKRELEALQEQLFTQGADFTYLAEEHSDDPKIEYAFGRGEMEQSFEAAAFSLETGELSQIIETADGWHLIKCISDYDEERTRQNKEALLRKRKQEAFDREYAGYIKGLLSEFNQNAWGKISFEDLEAVDNRNLYEVYEEYRQDFAG